MGRLTVQATAVSVPRMERATVLQETGKNSRKGSKVIHRALLSLFAACLVLACSVAVYGADTTKILEKSGIRYPDGFDVNTVGEIRGIVQSITRPEKGPVTFDLSTAGGTYTVIASPLWYWDDVKIKLSDGDDIKVIGSKAVGKDGNLYVIAQEISVSGTTKPFVLRDVAGAARWQQIGGGSGSRGGYGAGYGGRGGSGGGLGGAGRGGRR
jgi:hypothetical protein